MWSSENGSSPAESPARALSRQAPPHPPCPIPNALSQSLRQCSTRPTAWACPGMLAKGCRKLHPLARRYPFPKAQAIRDCRVCQTNSSCNLFCRPPSTVRTRFPEYPPCPGPEPACSQLSQSPGRNRLNSQAPAHSLSTTAALAAPCGPPKAPENQPVFRLHSPPPRNSPPPAAAPLSQSLPLSATPGS